MKSQALVDLKRFILSDFREIGLTASNHPVSERRTGNVRGMTGR